MLPNSSKLATLTIPEIKPERLGTLCIFGESVNAALLLLAGDCGVPSNSDIACVDPILTIPRMFAPLATRFNAACAALTATASAWRCSSSVPSLWSSSFGAGVSCSGSESSFEISNGFAVADKFGRWSFC